MTIKEQREALQNLELEEWSQLKQANKSWTLPLVLWAEENQADLFLTIAFNRHKTFSHKWNNHQSCGKIRDWTSIRNDTKIAITTSEIRHLFAKADRARLGSKWAKKPLDQRLWYVGSPEHLSGNIHYHLAVNTRDWDRVEMEAVMKKHWKKMVPSGNLHFAYPRTKIDLRRTTSYSLKTLEKDIGCYDFIFS